MRPGPLIAIDVVCLYTLLSPMVLFGIYVFFDLMGQGAWDDGVNAVLSSRSSEKDPGLWGREEIFACLDDAFPEKSDNTHLDRTAL